MSPSERVGVRWHVFRCPACARYIASMRKTIGLMADSPPPPPPPPEVEDRILAALRNRRPSDGV
jgi:anti-sigma factor RsiW